MLKNSLLKIQKRPNIGLSGEYRLVVRRVVDGGVTRDTGWIPNLITDAGLNRLGSGGWSGWCHIGTGTTAPAVGDVALAAQAASTSSTVPGGATSNSGSPLYRTTTTLAYRFNTGQLNGNYTEVGISWGNGGTFIGLRGTDEAEGFKGAVRGEEGNRPVDKGYWGRVYA